MQQLQNLQNLLLDKQLEANNSQSKKDDTVGVNLKLILLKLFVIWNFIYIFDDIIFYFP